METTDNNPMTLAELEALAELYFEASLSRADERLLMKVLAESGISSPVLDEARAVMGLELTRPEKRVDMLKPRRSLVRRVRVWSSVAAAALVLAVGGVGFIRQKPSLDGEAVYIAYANGKRITDESEARRQALADYENSMMMMREMQARSECELRRSQEMINQLN